MAAAKGRKKIVEVLLDHVPGPDINARTASGETALHLASHGGHLATIQVLVKHGADINTSDAAGNTALHLLAVVEDFEAITWLTS
jgi:ankyrin repeat protein